MPGVWRPVPYGGGAGRHGGGRLRRVLQAAAVRVTRLKDGTFAVLDHDGSVVADALTEHEADRVVSLGYNPSHEPRAVARRVDTLEAQVKALAERLASAEAKLARRAEGGGCRSCKGNGGAERVVGFGPGPAGVYGRKP